MQVNRYSFEQRKKWRGCWASDLVADIIDEWISYDPHIIKVDFGVISLLFGGASVKRNFEISRCVYDSTLYHAI